MNGVVLVFTVNAIFFVIIVITFIFSNFIIITSYDKYGIVDLSVYLVVIAVFSDAFVPLLNFPLFFETMQYNKLIFVVVLLLIDCLQNNCHYSPLPFPGFVFLDGTGRSYPLLNACQDIPQKGSTGQR